MRMHRLMGWALLVGVAALVWGRQAHALRPIDAWPLKDDDGDLVSEHDDRETVVYVRDIGDVSNPDPISFRGVLSSLSPTANLTIVFKRRGLGMAYPVNGDWFKLGQPGHDGVAHVTIRGETDNPADTVIDANQLDHLFELWNAADIRFAYITFQNSKKSLIRVHGETVPTVSGFQFYRVDLINGGYGAIEASGDPAEDGGTGNVCQNFKIEFCHIGFPGNGSFPNDPGDTDCRSGYPSDGKAHGILCEGGVGWIIRHNLFFWIVPRQKPDGVRQNYSILMSNNAKDTEVYGNTFNYCEAPVTFGLKDHGSPTAHGHFRGLVKNNGIYRFQKKIVHSPLVHPLCQGWLDDYPAMIFEDAAQELKVVHNTISFYDGGTSAWAVFVHAGSNGFICKNNLSNSINEVAGGAMGTRDPNVDTLNATGYGPAGTNGTDNGLGFVTSPPNNGETGGWTPAAAWLAWLHNHYEYNPLLGHWGTYKLPLYGAVSHAQWMADFHINRNTDTEDNVIDKVPRMDEVPGDWDTGLRRRFLDDLGATISVESADYGCDEWNVGRPAYNFGGNGGGQGGAKPRLPHRIPGGTRGKTTTGTDQDWRNYLLQRKAQREAQEKEDARTRARDQTAEDRGDWSQAIRDSKNANRTKREAAGNEGRSGLPSRDGRATRNGRSGAGRGIGN